MPEIKEGAARLWLVRHGESTAQTGEELSIDSSLSTLGRKQAARLVEPLGKVRFAVAFVSPLKRARQTFEAATTTISECVFDSRIVEVMQKDGYLPLLPYKNLPFYAAPDRHNAWNLEITERVDAFMKDMTALSKECSDILVVSHAMVINVALHRFFGSDPFKTRLNCHPANASVSIIERSPDADHFDTLRLWNHQGHLAGLSGVWRL